jgi:hypothetical protein
MASMNQLTKMVVDQSCNRFQTSLIRYLGLPHQQLPYFISLFNILLKLTIIIHQSFHLLSSTVQEYVALFVSLSNCKMLKLQVSSVDLCVIETTGSSQSMHVREWFSHYL